MVGALAVGAAIFGAEEYPEEFLDEFYDFDSNPTADTQDEETLAIAYAAWKHSKENRLYESETNYSRIYEAASGDSDYDDYLDELEEDALVLYKDNPSQLFEKAYPIDYEVGMNDYESSLLADIQSGYTENSMMFDEDENLTPYGERVLKEMYDSLIDESLGIEWLASRHPPSEILKRGDPIAYRVGMSEYEDGFESESDGFTYAYSKGHKDGMKDEVVYRPSIDTDREKNIYKKILRQKAETFEAGNMMVKLQEVDGEAPYYNCPYCRNELTVLGGNGGIVAVCENESRCNGLEIPRQYLDDYEKYHWYVNERSSNENMEAEGSNMKMALGILGVGVGAVALLGGERIKKIFEKLGL